MNISPKLIPRSVVDGFLKSFLLNEVYVRVSVVSHGQRTFHYLFCIWFWIGYIMDTAFFLCTFSYYSIGKPKTPFDHIWILYPSLFIYAMYEDMLYSIDSWKEWGERENRKPGLININNIFGCMEPLSICVGNFHIRDVRPKILLSINVYRKINCWIFIVVYLVAVGCV